MTLLDCLVCFAISLRFHNSDAELKALARRLLPLTRSDKALFLINGVLKVRHPRRFIELILQGAE